MSLQEQSGTNTHLRATSKAIREFVDSLRTTSGVNAVSLRIHIVPPAPPVLETQVFVSLSANPEAERIVGSVVEAEFIFSQKLVGLEPPLTSSLSFTDTRGLPLEPQQLRNTIVFPT
jgi:hypothetical protein